MAAAVEAATTEGEHSRTDHAVMRDDFKPLRRKIGLITLVMACLFAAGWVRSGMFVDIITVPSGPHTMDSAYSVLGGLFWVRFREIPMAKLPPTKTVTARLQGTKSVFDKPNVEWKWRLIGFGSGGCYKEGVTFWTIPYWSVAFPLTLLSAWLLLSKSKQPKLTADPPV
jgi:hypothetical protein